MWQMRQEAILPQEAPAPEAISYRSNNKGIATVDNNGVVTVKSAGSARITATKAGDAKYNPTEKSYILTVNKIAQTGFGFAQSTVTATYLTDETVRHTATGGEGNGLITYDSNNTGVATVDKDGVVTINGAGTAIITATKAGDNNYLPASAIYSLKVVKPLMTLGIKNIKFDWQDFVTTATHHYRLLSSLGDNGGYSDASTTGFAVTPNSTNVTQTNARADIALHRYVPLLNRKGAQYEVEACDAGNTCSDDPVANASLSNAQLNQLIGYIKASNTGRGDEFGTSVSISGDGNTLAVGARNEDSNSTGVDGVENNNNTTDTGAVYVFVRDSSSSKWSQQAYIKASNTGEYDQFGYSVSLSENGNTLAVGGL